MAKKKKTATQTTALGDRTFHDLFQNSPVGMFRSSFKQGILLEANDALLRIFHASTLEPGWMADSFVHPSDRQQMETTLLRQGFIEGFVAQFKRSDGTILWGEYSSRLLPDHDLLEGVLIDITKRKRAEEKLRQSDERFQFVTRATNEVVSDWNLETNSLWWNEGMFTQFGYRPQELESGIESWSLRIHPEDHSRVTTRLHEFMQSGGKIWTEEYRFRRADGTYAHVDRKSVV